MQPVQYNQLVAVPFNAIASRARQHKNCNTFGMSRQLIWQQVTEMMREHYENWGNGGDRNSSSYHFMRARFILDDWPLERIASHRDQFLAFETRNTIKMTTGNRISYGFIIIDKEKSLVLGERRTGHMSYETDTASGIDIIRPSERGKGLSRDFFELGCLIAKEMGYTSYKASIAANLPASYKRLEHMVQEGRAKKTPSDWDGAKRYSIDLKNFTPRPASARCG